MFLMNPSCSNKKDNNIVKSFPDLTSIDDVCGKILSTGMTFLEAIPRDSPTSDNVCIAVTPLDCRVCLKTFNSESKLRTHKKSHKLCFCDRKWSTKKWL